MSGPFKLEIEGRGTWYNIHRMAIYATTPQKKIEFVHFFTDLTDTFFCEKCRVHMKNYLNTNPIEPYFDLKDNEGRDTGIFLWTWAFHNAVNARLNKRIIPYGEAYLLFADKQCDIVCSVDNNDIPVTTPYGDGSSVNFSPRGRNHRHHRRR